MPKQASYDVVIVGASIAGCTAATLFGRRGLNVALIEREGDPKAYKKICTHYIQPSATPTIERLGLAGSIETAGGIRNSLEVWTRWGWIRASRDTTGGHPAYGYNIRRQKLDPMLRSLAASTPGVEFMPGLTACQLISADNRFAGVQVEGKGGERHNITACLVVAADGRNSRIAELSGVPTKVKPHNRFAYFAYYRNLPLVSGKNSQLWFLEPDVAYTFPNDDDLTLLACFLTKDKLARFKENIEENFVRFFEGLPNGPAIRNAERVSEILGMINMPNIARQAALPGLAFVGDAALASDPLWGVGCGWAFQTAEWLVDCTANSLLTNGNLDHTLKRYRKKHRSLLSGHHFLISDFSSRRSFNPIEKLFFSAAARDPVMARHLDAYGARNIGVLQFFSPLALARALRVNITRHLKRPSVA